MNTLRLVETPEMPARRNLALTEALTRRHAAGPGPETLRLQHFPPCAIVGRHQDLGREVDLAWCAAHGVELARRMTGGGAITMEPGILGWELVLHRRRFPGGLGEAAALLCRGAAAGLAALGIGARFRPRNDIEVDGRKLAGTGGYFDGDTLLFQGTVLVAPDLALMAQALRLPRAKATRDPAAAFADRLTDLSRLLGTDANMAEAGGALAQGLASALGVTLVPGSLLADELEAAEAAFAELLGRDDFVLGTDLTLPGIPPADATAELATPGAAVAVALRLRPGLARRIALAHISGDMFATPPRVVRDLEAALAGVPLAEAEAAARSFLAQSGAALLGGDIMQLADAVGAAARGGQ